MSRKFGSTARGRRLRRDLRLLRESVNLSTDEAGSRAAMSGPTLSRIESGKRGVSVDETERLLDVYDVPLTKQRKILDLAERTNELGWWQPYESHLREDAQSTIALEEQASRIVNFELMLIPGLLQTAEYARDIIQASNFDDSPQVIETKVAARMARQSVLSRPDHAPELVAILDEAALHRARDPQIMKRQLKQLLDAAERPNVLVQVVPFSAGQHASAESPCVVFEFGDDPAIVYLEGKISGLFLEELDEVAVYQETVRRLSQVALNASESHELIDRISKELP
ncbi:helix-turn-helix protein [Murinocardiopsis flavida]|uniref:Helix-turn-helix protein n=1 Tax=Murinocardiopsis flavida TaxID=645275 RepID=A0A2P8CSU2_9ACTN|nr:helix-turn-helix transcriptional regulator [Murinocardiopsis flavida]PSK88045.1 helix-turn-helix protein [Murinocardiopsis flavida]